MADVDWDVVADTLSAFQSVIRLRTAQGWELHSWNAYESEQGGGRIGRYTEIFVASVWKRNRCAGGNV